MNEPRRQGHVNADEATRFDLPLRKASVGLNLDTPTRDLAGSYYAPTAIVNITSFEPVPLSVQSEMTLFSPLMVLDVPTQQVTAVQPVPAFPQHAPVGPPIRPFPVLDVDMRTQAEALVVPTPPNATPPQPQEPPAEANSARRETVARKSRTAPRSGTLQIVLGAVAAASCTLAAAFGGVWWQAQRQTAQVEAGAGSSPRAVVPAPQKSQTKVRKVEKPEAAPAPKLANVPTVAPNPPTPTNELTVQAVEHLRAGRLDAALSAYRQLAQQFPEQPAFRAAADILGKKLARAARKEAQTP